MGGASVPPMALWRCSMIKRFAILLACLSFAVSAYGDGEIIETVRMTGGSYTYTNTARVPNWHLDCVALAIPVTNANTLAVNHVRTLTVTDDPVAVVTTNAAGWVETNTWNVATRTDYAITNALLSVSSTNDITSNVYDVDDGIPKDYLLQFMDKLVFTTTITNGINLIFCGNK